MRNPPLLLAVGACGLVLNCFGLAILGGHGHSHAGGGHGHSHAGDGQEHSHAGDGHGHSHGEDRYEQPHAGNGHGHSHHGGDGHSHRVGGGPSLNGDRIRKPDDKNNNEFRELRNERPSKRMLNSRVGDVAKLEKESHHNENANHKKKPKSGGLIQGLPAVCQSFYAKNIIRSF